MTTTYVRPGVYDRRPAQPEKEPEMTTATEAPRTTKPAQQQKSLPFAELLFDGVDHRFDKAVEDPVKSVVQRAKAVASMVAQAAVQPRRDDRVHALERGAELARHLAKTLEALVREIDEGLHDDGADGED